MFLVSFTSSLCSLDEHLFRLWLRCDFHVTGSKNFISHPSEHVFAQKKFMYISYSIQNIVELRTIYGRWDISAVNIPSTFLVKYLHEKRLQHWVMRLSMFGITPSASHRQLLWTNIIGLLQNEGKQVSVKNLKREVGTNFLNSFSYTWALSRVISLLIAHSW